MLCNSFTRPFMFALAAACCLALSTKTLFASVAFDWVTVGNPGNAADSTGFGAVAYRFRMSKYEVTNDQYAEFLNAVDAAGTNPYDVYDPRMGSSIPIPGLRGGIEFNAAAAEGAKYSAKTNFGNKPVNFVSFFDSMRFVNWLENGQPNDGSGTENGVYTIGSGANEIRAASARFFIPSEDEWYKAAYYDPRLAAAGGPPGDDHYWRYPTSSDFEPTIATANATGDISNPGINVANYDRGADWNGEDGNVTTVGSAGAGSASFYGTFDQAGNVWEWNEAVTGSFFRGLRGGEWSAGAGLSAAPFRRIQEPTFAFNGEGFRVASIPEPSSGLLFVSATVGLLMRRRTES